METIRLNVLAAQRLGRSLEVGNLFLKGAVGLGLAACAGVAFPEAAAWFGLGLIATVGFGFGVHTGPLKLFPLACARGSQMDFWPAYHNLFWPAFWWGTGCAVGEIPPFLFARAGLAAVPFPGKSWLYRHGWLFVFVNACWPSGSFDVCGLLSGAMGMSFVSFFSATWCGTALVKALTLEVPFFILLCSGRVPFLTELHGYVSSRTEDRTWILSFVLSILTAVGTVSCLVLGCRRVAQVELTRSSSSDSVSSLTEPCSTTS